MLYITVPSTELWDENKEEWSYTKEQHLKLEHSLVSLSKWESKWCKPFLAKGEKTLDEITDYVRCMTVNPSVDPIVYKCLTMENLRDIAQYIDAPMTATRFTDDHSNTKRNSEIPTSELIYYWMIALNIPFECQRWHLNRLLTLIRVCNIKNQPEKKMSKREIMKRNAALNEARRKKFKTKG